MSSPCLTRWFDSKTLRHLAAGLLALTMMAVPATTRAQQLSDTTRLKGTPIGSVRSEAIAADIRVPTRFKIEPELQRELDRLGVAQRDRIRGVGIALARDRFDKDLERRWKDIVRDVRREDTGVHVEALVQAVLREAYLETDRVLRDHADRVRFLDDLKRRLRGEILRVQSETDDSLSRYLSELEGLLMETGQSRELTNTDFQNLVQRANEMHQMLSKVSRALHDSAMEVIRNMGL